MCLCLNGCTSQDLAHNQDGMTRETMVSQSPTETLSSEGITTTREKLEPTTEATQVPEPITWAESMLSQMTLEEKVGQLFYLSVADYAETTIPAGGVIYFKSDLIDWPSVKKDLTAKQNESDIPLFFGIDEEGGIITRITGKDSIGGTPVSSAWVLAQQGEKGAVYEANSLIASELADLGFNMNFAPVADINSNPSNPVIGKRAFSDNPEETAFFVLQALDSYKDTGVIPVVKHFPGHGDTKGDSHLNSVYVSGSLSDLEARELIPFSQAISYGVEVIMVGHIQLPEVTREALPASLSEEILQEILRDRMGYQGLIISDALNMGGISQYYDTEQVVELGLAAGLDMFLMPEDAQASYDFLLEKAKEDPRTQARINASVYRILSLKEQELK